MSESGLEVHLGQRCKLGSTVVLINVGSQYGTVEEAWVPSIQHEERIEGRRESQQGRAEDSTWQQMGEREWASLAGGGFSTPLKPVSGPLTIAAGFFELVF